MPYPKSGSAHIDGPLSNLALKAFQSREGYIGQELFPVVPVGKQSDGYYVIDKAAWLRVPDTKRSPRSRANRVEFTVSTDTYYAQNYALAGEIPLEDLTNADAAIRLRQNTTDNVVDQLARDREVRIANTVTSGSNVGSYVSLSGTSKWNDFVNSSPMSDVTTGHAYIRQQTGLIANTAVIDHDTMQIVRRHPELLDYYKYSRGGTITMDELRAAFQVERILVGQGVKNNALEGATASITNIWGNNVLLARIVPPAGLQTATLGLGMQWRPDGFPAPMAVQRSRFDGAGEEHVEVLEAMYWQDEKIVASDLGYLIGSTL